MTQGGTPGDLILIDSVSTNSGIAVVYHSTSPTDASRNYQIVIENLVHDTSNPIAVDDNDTTTLGAVSSIDTWVWGNVAPGGFQSGANSTTTRPSALLNGDKKFFTADAPTYAGYAIDQVVNVKGVNGTTVMGDGKTDDSAALNTILAQNAAACKITYFPYGVYIVQDTLVIPPGSRLMGEAFAVISGAGDKFKDATNPVPIVQVGNSAVGTTGVAHISDMRFSVSEILPGAIIMEVNMAGNPGDVGIWNSLFTVGGTEDTSVSQCSADDVSTCMAAFMSLHLTNSSSAYLQNTWFVLTHVIILLC
ncbi:MAG: glycosyl hydrolase family 28-related protein [Janthinobacterium lividum]